jgi:pimeloyl-ACP methyl ester carboxylesterase
MKKTLLITLLLAVSSFIFAQDYSIGHTTFNFSDPARPGRIIGTEIYYPAITAGDDVPVAGGPKFPFVIMSHGFLMSYSAYENIWDELVSLGYIVVLPTTASELLPDHEDYAKDIAFLSIRFSKLAKVPGSIFYNRIINRCAAMGHSMGGGATLLAMQYPNRIKTNITFAAAETSPSALAVCPTITIPSLVMAGEDDCVTPPADQQLPMYEAIAALCKTYISINGASHCQFANYNFNCSLGELFCPTGISRTEQHSIINDFMEPWLDYYLKNNSAALLTFEDRLSTSADISYLRECSARLPDESFEEDAFLYPNPVQNHMTAEVSTAGTYTIFSLEGRMIDQSFVNEGLHIINTEFLPAGIYVFQFVSPHGEQTISFSKQ